MKKNILLLVVFATFSFISCNEDQNNFTQNKFQSAQIEHSYEQINLLSEEVSEFHNNVINYFLRELYKPTDVMNEEYLLNLRQMILDQAGNYDFKYMNKNDFNDELIEDDEFLLCCFNAMQYDTLNLSSLSHYNEDCLFDFSLIEKKSNRCALELESLFYDSESPEEFESKYNAYIEEALGQVTDKYNYMCIRFYADMYMSSFITWSNYLFGESNQAKKPNGWLNKTWDKAKAKAKKFWKDVKPIVAADAGGAVTGAMIGSVGGLPGAGAGAVKVGCATSAGQAVQNLINNKSYNLK